MTASAIAARKEPLAGCFVCGMDRLTEDNSKLVVVRGEYVRICHSRACGYAIDTRRAYPVLPADAVKLR